MLAKLKNGEYASPHKSFSPTYNDAQALGVCLALSLSPGNVHPASSAAMAVCGALLLTLIIRIGVPTNAFSTRYARATM